MFLIEFGFEMKIIFHVIVHFFFTVNTYLYLCCDVIGFWAQYICVFRAHTFIVWGGVLTKSLYWIFADGNHLISECYQVYIVRMFFSVHVHCAVELYWYIW